MSNPDTPDAHDDETGEPTPRVDNPTSGAAHSAPRPAAPLGLERPVPPAPPVAAPPADSGSTTAWGPATPETPSGAPSQPSAPSRVSAFGPPESAAPESGGSDSGPTSPMRTVPSSPTTAGETGRSDDLARPVAPTAPLPVTPGSTTTTRVVPPGATVPLASAESLAGSTGGALRTGTATETVNETVIVNVEREAPQEDGWVPVSTRRTAAHIWGVVITLLVLPVAWFLLADGALRTWYSLESPDSTANPAGLLSLAGGILALAVIALIARASSLGAWIWGGLVAAAGAVALAVPARVAELLEQIRPTLTSIHEGFGRNVYDYLLDTSRSGLLLVFGVVVLLFALVSHASRRSGRTEGRVKAERAAAGL